MSIKYQWDDGSYRDTPEHPGNMSTHAWNMQQQANQLPQASAAAARTADPWESQRGQYQTDLSQLMNNPGSAMQNNPFFKWQEQQGEQAVNRAAAANGQLTSGNRMTALSDYAQKQSGNQFFQLADLYSLLGGAKNQNPAAAGALQYQGQSDMQHYGQTQQALNQGEYQYQQNFNQDQQRFNDAQNAWKQTQPQNNGFGGSGVASYY